MTALVTEPICGFILDCFAGRRQGREVVYVTGRLESGETFGIVDHAPIERLFVRREDSAKAKDVAVRMGGQAVDFDDCTMAGEAITAVQPAIKGGLKGLESALGAADIEIVGGENRDPAIRYLTSRGLRGAVRIVGTSRASAQLGRVFENPRVTPCVFQPKLLVLAIDIETDETFQKLTAISMVGWWTAQGSSADSLSIEEVLLVSEKQPEKQLLVTFLQRLHEIDPDILTGWNVIDFDLPLIMRRMDALGIQTRLGRTREPDVYQEGRGWGQSRMYVRGRQVLDAMHLVRVMPRRFDDFRLGTVATALLGRGKTLVAEEWQDTATLLIETYRTDPAKFAEYCLEDSRLVRDILLQEHLIDLTVSRSLLVGLPMDRVWGSIVSFDFIYMSELRRKGCVAPPYRSPIDAEDEEIAPGGLVMEPQAGLYSNILVFDFKSLYPSIMRTFNIDPWAHARAESEAGDLIFAPNGAAFVRERGILPAVLDRFFESRAEARKNGDIVGAYVYKIIMNSFYGVLGARTCRFASGALAGAITNFGHLLLRWMRAHFEALGYTVLYGDTDSLFVDTHQPKFETRVVLKALGERLCSEANDALSKYVLETYRVESRLELEFEKCYRRFLLPRARGGEGSRAKNYAGLVEGETQEKNKLEIVGMEAVRSDWTKAARDFQTALLQLLFQDATPEVLSAHVQLVLAKAKQGELDGDLVYRKNIRRSLDAYTNAPPHVRAARMLPKPVKVVRYVITARGPQPIGFVDAPVDVEHYIEKQLLPVAESIAEFGQFSLSSNLDKDEPQQTLF